jgi:hypothetical protein
MNLRPHLQPHRRLLLRHLLRFLSSRLLLLFLASLPWHRLLDNRPLVRPKHRLLLRLAPHLRQLQRIVRPRYRLAILRKGRLHRRRLLPACSHPTILLESLRRIHQATHQRSLPQHQRKSPACTHPLFPRHRLVLPLFVTGEL